MQSHDRTYYLARERSERDIADRCDDISARRIHLEMAARYRALTERPQIA